MRFGGVKHSRRAATEASWFLDAFLIASPPCLTSSRFAAGYDGRVSSALALHTPTSTSTSTSKRRVRLLGLPRHPHWTAALVGLLHLSRAPESHADPDPADPATTVTTVTTVTAPPAPSAAAGSPAVVTPPVVLGGYVEAFYQWNPGAPANRLTNFRGFDNRSDSFTLANVALDASWDHERTLGRLTLQVGHTPSTYYGAEPSEAGASGVNPSNGELWKYLQQAYVGYRFPVGRGLTITAGLFLSPIGPESIVVHENWNWSRSNLFFGLPFYHAGARAVYPLTDRWTATGGLVNGWNAVVDDNTQKSVFTQLTYAASSLSVSALYFGGAERPTGAPEGDGRRHLFDAHVTWTATKWLSLLAHGDTGFERTRFGVSSWRAGALSARVGLDAHFFLAARLDGFAEHRATNQAGTASPIAWPAAWVSSGTLTAELRPGSPETAHASFRLEYRHDQASRALFFGGDAAADPTAPGTARPNRRDQDTVTLGATTWF
jgi:hypothetical protein